MRKLAENIWIVDGKAVNFHSLPFTGAKGAGSTGLSTCSFNITQLAAFGRSEPNLMFLERAAMWQQLPFLYF